MVDTKKAVISEADNQVPKANTGRSPRSLREIVADHYIALQQYHLALLNTAEVEAVHKMRVTTRRLQASLDLLQTGDQLKRVRRLKRRLRGWRRRLSEVRNYDVFLLLIENKRYRRRSRTSDDGILKAMFERRREKRVGRARVFFEKLDLTGFGRAIGMDPTPPAALPASREEPDGTAPDSASHNERRILDLADDRTISVRAAERLEQRLAEFQLLAASSETTTEPAELHQLRIAAKRLRYLLEVVSEMGYGDAARAITGLRTLQDRIGEWHDLEAFESQIISIISRKKFLQQHLVEASRILQIAAQVRSKKQGLARRLFPIRPPRPLASSTRRLVRSLRKQAMISRPPNNTQIAGGNGSAKPSGQS